MRTQRGFTLLELTVSISIILIIIGIAMFNHRTFSDVVELGNVTEAVALKIREAQLKGLAVREFSSGSTFEAGRGVYFDSDTSDRYVYFADVGDPPDGEYNPENNDEALETEILRRGFVIDSIEAFDGTVWVELDEVAITFRRPRPEARIVGDDGSGQEDYTDVRVIISSPYNRKAYIEINRSGQITTRRSN